MNDPGCKDCAMTGRTIQIRLSEHVSCLSLFPHADLRALTMFSLAALTEGRNPPMIPIRTENISEFTMIEAERENPNAISVNDPKLIMEMSKSCNTDAKARPMPPPRSDI